MRMAKSSGQIIRPRAQHLGIFRDVSEDILLRREHRTNGRLLSHMAQGLSLVDVLVVHAKIQ